MDGKPGFPGIAGHPGDVVSRAVIIRDYLTRAGSQTSVLRLSRSPKKVLPSSVRTSGLGFVLLNPEPLPPTPNTGALSLLLASLVSQKRHSHLQRLAQILRCSFCF